LIKIDIPGRLLELLVDEQELKSRKKSMILIQKELRSPLLKRYVKLVGDVSEGATLE
jgi:dihydroxy-acid dehydratase